VVSLFCRQFLRNGCLVDFTSLLECWDEYQKEKSEFIKKELNLKRASIRVTDRVKNFTTSETVGDKNEDDEDENNI